MLDANLAPPRLELSTLLTPSGIDPGEVVVLRNRPREPGLRKVFPWLAVDRPELYRLYQAVQMGQAARDIKKAKYLLSLLALEAAAGTYAAFYAIGDAERCDEAAFWALPGQDELKAFGLVGYDIDKPDQVLIDLKPLPLWPEWVGKLTLDWPKPEIRWWRSAASAGFGVRSIVDESRFGGAMPSWDQLVLDWKQLQVLPPTWQGRLAEWRGVYFIYDTERRQGYVGSAYGADNILGRWQAYGRTRDGGNVGLKGCDPDQLRFSILQRTSPDLVAEDVIAIETAWKARLHTREFGLNRN